MYYFCGGTMNYEMKYSALGNTGLHISRIGYGCAGLGNIYTPISEEDARESIRKAYEEYGINYFDTAASYGKHSLSERVLGKSLKDAGIRNKVIIATKCGDYEEDQYVQDYTYSGIISRFEAQLKRLQTDYVDILQLHDFDYAPSMDIVMEESIPALQQLKKEGKARFIGITSVRNTALKYVLERTDCLDMILTFARYNLMDTSLVGYFDELRKQKKFGVLNCSVLFMGFLTRRTLEGGYSTNEWLASEPGIEEAMQALREASALCDAHGVDIGNLAVQFGCDCDFCESTILSMGRTKRLDQNMEILRQPYDKELALQVHEILKKHSVIPEEFTTIK